MFFEDAHVGVERVALEEHRDSPFFRLKVALIDGRFPSGA